MSGQNLKDQIIKLKQEKNALILAHYYQEGDIQDIADFVGDSFQLALMGQKSSASSLLMAGVVFMAESIKILNPDKKVLVPDLNAGCSLVTSSPYEDYLSWRLKYPEALALTYINSSTEVKSISDIIVTSSNAQKIIESIPSDRTLLFGPDKNLGAYLSRVTNRKMILWPGTCQVHIQFSAKKLYELIKSKSLSCVLAHPECDETLLQFADIIGSTSRLLAEVSLNPASTFIVATEPGIIHQMKKVRPDAEFIMAPQDESCHCHDCPYMKLNSMEKILNALKTQSPEINVSSSLAQKARRPLERMIQVAQGETVNWPQIFSHL